MGDHHEYVAGGHHVADGEGVRHELPGGRHDSAAEGLVVRRACGEGDELDYHVGGRHEIERVGEVRRGGYEEVEVHQVGFEEGPECGEALEHLGPAVDVVEVRGQVEGALDEQDPPHHGGSGGQRYLDDSGDPRGTAVEVGRGVAGRLGDVWIVGRGHAPLSLHLPQLEEGHSLWG